MKLYEAGINTKGKYYLSTKKLLDNYENIKMQVKSFEAIVKKRYEKVFVNVDINDLSAEEIAEMMTTKEEFTRSEVKLLECRRTYLKSKYLLELIDAALEELKTREGGLLQYEIVKEMSIHGIKMEYMEEYMMSKGRPMSASTIYRAYVQGISNLSVLLWGYKAIANDLTDELYSKRMQDLFDLVA